MASESKAGAGEAAAAHALRDCTLSRFILVEQRKHPEATGDLTILLACIELACKVIASAVRRAGACAAARGGGSGGRARACAAPGCLRAA